MTSVTSTTATTGATSGTASSSSSSSTSSATAQLGSNYQTFLTLLTTQLKNQDPLSPTDSTQFTNQLVLFSQDEQQISMNDKLQKLVDGLSGQNQQAAVGYIGLNVTSNAGLIDNQGSSQTVGYNLPAKANSATISITDSTGRTVWSQPAATDAGDHSFTWSGQDNSGNAVAKGTYNLAVTATDASGKAITASTSVSGTVNAVEQQNGTTELVVGGTAMPLSSITSAKKPS